MLKELKYKMFDSGNRLNLLIGINVIVFLIITLLDIVGLLSKAGPFGKITADWLSMPTNLAILPKRFWTPFTYMFTHRDFLHFLMNMIGLYWFGRIFLTFLNKAQLTFAYLAGGLAGAFLMLLAYNVFPLLEEAAPNSYLIGASAGVFAVIVGAATLVPDYAVMLFIFGEVRIKYLALLYVLIDIVQLLERPGTSFSHLGGAALGFVFIKALQNGRDWSKLFNRKPKLKVVSRNEQQQSGDLPAQEIIDAILDKISTSGYDSLTKHEKQQLFNASKDEARKN